MKIVRKFPASYRLEPERDWIETRTRYYYPGGSTIGGRNGIAVRVFLPDGTNWSAVFAEGPLRTGAGGIFHSPDSKRFLAIHGGQGYLVRAEAPDQWCLAGSPYIALVRCLPSKGLIILADSVNVWAYDTSGLAWRTQRSTLGDLKIVEFRENEILAEYSDANSGTVYPINIDLRNGHVERR